MAPDQKLWENNEEITYFREYLRIPSVHPDPNYGPCIEFLKKQAEGIELPITVYYPFNEKNPIVIITWAGTEPDLKAILLNSHMDVVPVFPENWTYPPFGAEIDVEGRIFARGTQDMKCVGMQYLGAIRALKRSGATFKRTIHLSFVADEEMGGRRGMRPFVNTDAFKSLNIGFSLDEGLASPTEVFPVFYAERSVWRINFKIFGASGHGSLLLKNTAGESLRYLVDKMMDLRKREVERLDNNPELTIGDVTTINLTRLGGGVQSNVIPPMFMACFDIRLALDVNHADFEAMLQRWCDDVGGNIELEYEQKLPRVEPTTTDASNQFWMAFKNATEELGLNIKKEIFTGGTDSRYIRQMGIPALGFSPMNNTPILLHDHDEFIKADVYLRGIEIYKKIISNLADVSAF